MTRTSFVSTVVILTALVVAGIAVRSWLEAHDDRLQMQATIDAQKQLIVSAEQREQQRAAELKDTLAQIAGLKRQVQTPQQIIRELPQYLPLPQSIQLVPAGSAETQRAGSPVQQGSGFGANTPAPATLPDAPQPHLPKGHLYGSVPSDVAAAASQSADAFAPSEAGVPSPSSSNPSIQHEAAAPVSSGNVSKWPERHAASTSATASPQTEANPPAPRAANVPGQSSGNAPSAVQFPVEDLKPLYDFVQDCRACKLQLDAAHADLADERARSSALAKERDAAIKAAKGSFWSRLKRNAKWFALGAATGLALRMF